MYSAYSRLLELAPGFIFRIKLSNSSSTPINTDAILSSITHLIAYSIASIKLYLFCTRSPSLSLSIFTPVSLCLWSFEYRHLNVYSSMMSNRCWHSPRIYLLNGYTYPLMPYFYPSSFSYSLGPLLPLMSSGLSYILTCWGGLYPPLLSGRSWESLGFWGPFCWPWGFFVSGYFFTTTGVFYCIGFGRCCWLDIGEIDSGSFYSSYGFCVFCFL